MIMCIVTEWWMENEKFNPLKLVLLYEVVYSSDLHRTQLTGFDGRKEDFK